MRVRVFIVFIIFQKDKFMKQTATLLVLGIIISILASFAIANDASSKTPVKANAVLYNYQWFYDADLTYPTGSYSDVPTEVNRLKSTFPAYTFSDTWSMGLHEFDWGYRPYDNGAVIYSDMTY
jgi:hypothetical protein